MVMLWQATEKRKTVILRASDLSRAEPRDEDARSKIPALAGKNLNFNYCNQLMFGCFSGARTNHLASLISPPHSPNFINIVIIVLLDYPRSEVRLASARLPQKSQI